MKRLFFLTRPGVAMLVMAVAAVGFVVGCSEPAPKKPAGADKPSATQPKPDAPKALAEPAAKPEEPKATAEPAAKPEEPKAPAEPAAKPEEPKAPAAPAAKPEEPKAPAEPATKPQEPKAPTEPVAKPEEPKAPATPAAKPEEPKTPAEPAAKPEAAMPAPVGGDEVKVSAFAPAEDLVNQFDAILKDLTKAVESETEFKDAESKIPKDVNTLIVVAQALGLHDQENKYQKNAPAIVKAAQALAGAKGYADAKQGVEALAKAAAEGGEGPALTWEKMASLEELMKAVPLINTKLKRNTTGSRFKSRAKDTAGYAAVIAAIGHASIADLSETKSPEEVEKWKKYCVEMRDAAGALNAAIRAGDEKAAADVMAKLAQSCDDCHAVFHKEALGAGKEE